MSDAEKNDDGETVVTREHQLNVLARRCADYLDGTLGGIGFMLMVFDLGAEGFLSYCSNAQRDDVRRTMAEWLRRTQTFDEAQGVRLVEGEEVEVRGRRYRVDTVRRTRVTLAPIDLGGERGDDGKGR